LKRASGSSSSPFARTPKRLESRSRKIRALRIIALELAFLLVAQSALASLTGDGLFATIIALILSIITIAFFFGSPNPGGRSFATAGRGSW
jgi:hypothetical protein